MGRRVAVNSTTTVNDLQHITPVTVKKQNIRKRKYVGNAKSSTKSARINSNNSNDNWHENADDEDSSSNDTVDQIPARNLSCKHANNSSILLNTSLNTSIGSGGICNELLSPSLNGSPKPVYVLRPSMVNGTILSDLGQKPWRLGKPIGKGNFGEIFLASDNITVPVTNDNAKYVVKIEPHSNGPLFVEIHCLMNTAKKSFVNTEPLSIVANIDQNIPQMAPSGIPDYIASGSHLFGDARYRFLVLQRFDRDLHSLIRNSRVTQKVLLTLAVHIVTVLENLHNKGYCHNDVKAQNLMITKCKFYKTKLSKAKHFSSNNVNQNGRSDTAAISKNGSSKTKLKLSFKNEHDHYEEKQQTTDSGNSSEQDFIDDDDDDDDDEDEDFVIKRESKRRAKPLRDNDFEYEEHDDNDYDEDFDDGATSNSNNTNSMDCYRTPINKNSKRRGRNIVEFSGSNPVRSCRRDKPNAVYDEMVKSHYLRPTKRISYSEFFNDDGVPLKEQNPIAESNAVSSDDESEEFVPYKKSISPLKRKKSRLNQGSPTKSNNKENQRNIRHCRFRKNNLHDGMYAEPDDECSQHEKQYVLSEEERIYLIDYGLASKYIDRGIHRPFIMDQRRAHDGTLEFTSRDAHMGAHSRRSDLECLGYNLIYWSQGYLPWKEAAQQQQQEKVHRAKEFLMTDVREMLKQIYGKHVPKYLGEFLHQVGELNFHDRPNYERYRNLFKREYENLGYDSREMTLDSQEILRTCIKVKDEIDDKCDIFELNKHNALAWSALKNCSVSTPYQENSNGISRISPKNLRSKSDKKTIKKKKFSWAEILSQDPDQIARERAEKEFTREEESNDAQQRTVRRYEGKPTYAILEIQRRLIERGKWVDYEEDRNSRANDITMKKDENEIDDLNECDDEQIEEEEEDEDNSSDLEEPDDDEHDETMDSEESENNEDTVDSNTSSYKKRGRPTKCNKNSTKTKSMSRKKSSSSSSTSRSTTATSKKIQNQTLKTKKNVVTFNTKTRSSQQSKTKIRSLATSSCSSSSSSSISSTTATAANSSIQTSHNNSIISQQTNNNNSNSNNNTNNSKRGGATKYNRKASGCGFNQIIRASAAGEIEQNHGDQIHHHHHFAEELKVNDDDNKPLSQRRTRRCLIKTEKAMRNAVLVDQEDSNSNFSPDMRNLYLYNENMYYKSSLVALAAASKHCKK